MKCVGVETFAWRKVNLSKKKFEEMFHVYDFMDFIFYFAFLSFSLEFCRTNVAEYFYFIKMRIVHILRIWLR